MPTEVPWNLIPDRDPVPGSPEVLDRASLLSGNFRRSFLWTTAIADYLAASPTWMRARRPPPDASFVTVGFIVVPPGLQEMVKTQVPERTDGRFFFGVCLYPDQDAGKPVFERPIELYGQRFPVLVLPSEIIRHASATSPTHPVGTSVRGTATCWAEPITGGKNPTVLPGSGVLTAAHVGVRSVPQPGLPGTPYGVIGYAIDAVVLYPEAIPADASPLGVHAAPTAGADVEVKLQSGTTRATILEVFQPSNYVGVLCPHRIVIDSYFSPGDSGALVVDKTTQDAAGIYIGEVVPTDGSTNKGMCQIMKQVVDELAIKLAL